MRAFRISLVLFSVMVALIAVSTWYGRRVCSELEQMTQALPDEPSEQNVAAAEQLRDFWTKRTPYLRPIVNRTVVRTISDLISDLSVYADPTLDAAPEYRSTKQKLLGAIDEMRRAEKAAFGLWA